MKTEYYHAWQKTESSLAMEINAQLTRGWEPVPGTHVAAYDSDGQGYFSLILSREAPEEEQPNELTLKIQFEALRQMCASLFMAISNEDHETVAATMIAITELFEEGL